MNGDSAFSNGNSFFISGTPDDPAVASLAPPFKWAVPGWGFR